MTKKGLVRRIAQGGAIAGLCSLPVIANAQDYSQIQKGVNAATVEKETSTHVIYHFGFNKDLQRAIKGSKQPHLYLTGDKDSYILVDSDTSGYKLYYSKKNFDESGNGKKTVVLNIKGDEHINPCDNKGLGSKTNSLVSFYYTPTKGALEQPQPTLAPQGQPDNITNITINKDSHDIYNYNYFYGDTAKIKEKQQKLSTLEFRILIEGGKTVNPLKSPFWQASINPQIGRDWLWFGPYATFGFGSENNSTETPVYQKILLSQAAQIFTETEGTRDQNTKLKHPVGFGGTLSLNTNDNKVRFDLSYGLVNKKTSTSDVTESGFDRKLVGDQVIEEKSYNFVLEDGKTSNKWLPTQKIGMAFQPSNKVPIYIKGEAEHVGKISDKKGPVYFNVALGGNLGWRKK